GRGLSETSYRTRNITSPSRPASYNCDGLRGRPSNCCSDGNQAGCAATHATSSARAFGKIIAHGRWAGLPHSSPLMKLPSRPRPSPIGTSGATKSTVSKKCSAWRRDHHQPAASTPSRPPWKLMPPSHTLNSASGSVQIQRIATHRQTAAPAPVLAEHRDKEEPQQVHQAVPVHLDGADVEGHRIEMDNKRLRHANDTGRAKAKCSVMRQIRGRRFYRVAKCALESAPHVIRARG